MKKYVPDGAKIKRLRTQLDSTSTQKEFSHAVRISERKLRQIENQNAKVTSAELDRIGRLLGVGRHEIEATELSPVPHRPPAVGADDNITAFDDVTALMESLPPPKALGPEVWPRFENEYIQVIRDERALFELGHGAARVICHVNISLNQETQGYVGEVIELLQSLSWKKRSVLDSVEGLETVRIRNRMRELLVLLKGNDIWVYGELMLHWLPESDNFEPGASTRMEMHAIVVFAPPGEYGEDTVTVTYDHGRPRQRCVT